MIHSTAIIRGDVNIDETAIVEPYAVITGPARIGARAYIGAHAAIGAPAQHSDTAPAPRASARQGRGVVIGADACLREYCSVHQGVLQTTRVGNDSLLMAGCHVGHDSQLARGVTLATHSLLGGFTYIAEEATFGQGVVTHPWVVVGRGAMVGLNTSVISDVRPFAKVVGSPARVIGANQRKLAQHPEHVTDDLAWAEDVWEEFAELSDSRDRARVEWSALTA